MKYFIYILSCVFLSLLVACSPPPEPERPKGIVRIGTTPTELPIIVNGQPKGNSSSQGGQLFSISLEEGEYIVEILKPVDEEKDLYGSKTIFVAGDTLQTINIEAQERLTEFGKQQKAKRDIEVRELEEKRARQAAIKKQKVQTARKSRRVFMFDDWVADVTFSPSGKQILAASDPSKLIDINNGREVFSFRPNVSHESVAFSPDGKKLLTAGKNQFEVWDAISGEKSYVVKTGAWASPSAAHFSPDGKMIVTSEQNHASTLWNSTNGNRLHSLKKANNRDYAASNGFSPNGKIVAALSIDGNFRFYDTLTGAETKIIKTKNTLDFDFSPDGTRIITGGCEGNTRVFNISTGATIFKLKHSQCASSVAYSPEGKYIATGSGDEKVRLWEANSGRLLLTLAGHGDEIEGLEFSPDEAKLVSASKGDRMVRVWDIKKELAAK